MGNCFTSPERPYEKYRICSNNHQLIKRSLYFDDLNTEHLGMICYIPYEYCDVVYTPEDSILVTSIECPARIDIRWRLSKKGKVQLLSISNNGNHEIHTANLRSNINLSKILNSYIGHLRHNGVPLADYVPPMIDEAYV